MADPSILKKVIKGIGEIGAETVKSGVKEGVNIGQSVISGQELLGGIKKLDEKEEQQLKDEEEIKKEEWIAVNFGVSRGEMWRRN